MCPARASYALHVVLGGTWGTWGYLPPADATTTALDSPCLAAGIASGTSTELFPNFSPSPWVQHVAHMPSTSYLGVPGGTWGYLPPAIGRFWRELIYFMAMGGPQLQTFGFLLRLWSLFVTGGGLLALFHTCAALALSTIALTTHIAVLSLQIVVFSPVISVSFLFLTYVVLIKCAIRAYVSAITFLAPETDVAIPDDVFCFVNDSHRATQVMAVATLFRVVVDSGCTRSIICHEHAFVPGTLNKSKRPRIWGFNGSCALASGIGTVRVPFRDPANGQIREIVVEDALFCPDLKINLLSVNQMRKTRSDGAKGYHVDYQEEPLPVTQSRPASQT